MTSVDTVNRSAVAIIQILAAVCIAGCNPKYDPYDGPLLELPPEQVGQFTLVEAKQIEAPKGSSQILAPIDAIEAVYRSHNKRTVTLNIYSYPSAEEAIASLEKYRMLGGGDSDRLGGKIGNEEWKIEDKKSKEGLIGKRLASRDDVFWTNGNLFCVIRIQPADADPTAFERDLPF